MIPAAGTPALPGNPLSRSLSGKKPAQPGPKEVLKKIYNAPVEGIAYGVASIWNLGKDPSLFDAMNKKLSCTRYLFSLGYLIGLTSINSEAVKAVSGESTTPSRCLISLRTGGFIAYFVNQKMRTISEEFSSRSTHPLISQGLSRLTYALAGVAAITARVADAAIALVAVPASLLTLGKIKSLNHLALRALEAPAMLHDIFYYTVKVLNPQAGCSS